jgi:ArsR family transcriptional regulator, arsenate/arsenite/antimonite-responsive transcriptional repressor
MATATSAPSIETARAAELFHALSDTIRLDVVVLLLDGERCVCELMEALDLAQSRLSWHLKTLSDAGIITGRREGRWNYYSLNADVLGETRGLLESLRPKRRLAVRTNCCD